MVAGDKIKLIKRLGILNNIGSVYEVSRVTDKGFVFKSETTNGYLTLDDFKDYFELVTSEEPKKPIRPWSNWERDTLWKLNYPYRQELYVEKRNNGQRVQLRTLYHDKYVTASASCSPIDKFDEDVGLFLARPRLLSKVYKELANEIKDSL